MKNSIISLIVAIAIPLLLMVPKTEAGEYIKSLDITVIESSEGDVAIQEIGRHSPFRRYSWFRIGDVIQEVDGIKTSIYVLVALQNNQTPHIKYKRSGDLSAERQISLVKSVYGVPDFVNYK